jgi:hypothetical protein
MHKTGGRTKGTPNKSHAASRERITELCDPIAFLARIVEGKAIDGQVPTLEQRMSAAKDLRRAIVPDLKSVEIDNESDNVQRVVYEFAIPDSTLK